MIRKLLIRADRVIRHDRYRTNGRIYLYCIRRILDTWRDEAWNIVHACGQLDGLVLTKRPELIADRLPSDWGTGYPNVWLGTTVEDQSQIQQLEQLVRIPAAIRFVSAEPLLGSVEFGQLIRKLDWVITDCENTAKGERRDGQRLGSQNSGRVRYGVWRCFTSNITKGQSS